MSVLMMMRIKGDAGKLEKFSADNPAKLKAITDRAQSNGLIRHRFFGTADEIIVVDEWPDEASFQRFFDSSPDIGEMMQSVGVTSPPEITFARQLSVDDAVG